MIPNLNVGRASKGFLELALFYHVFFDYGIIEAMNKAEKRKQLEQIRRIEGLLTYAIKHDEFEEIERLRKELEAIVANL